MLATISLSSGYLPKKCSRTKAPSLDLKFWYSPSTHSSIKRLKNRRHRTQSHRYGGKLPEVRHQPGMRIGRQSVALDFLAETQELTLIQATFQIGTRVDSGTRVSLHEDHVSGMRGASGAPKMIEADFVQRCGGRVRGDVAAVLRIRAIR